MRRQSIKALTLAELVMALALAGIVALASTTTIQSAITTQKQAEDAAIFSMGEAGQGVEVAFQRIATAQNFNVVSPTEVRFTRQGTTARLYQESNTLVYQGNISDASTRQTLLKNLNNVSFSLDALNRVCMELALNDAEQTKMRTAVRTRNPYEPTVIARWTVN